MDYLPTGDADFPRAPGPSVIDLTKWHTTTTSLGSELVIVDIIYIMRSWRESREIVGKSWSHWVRYSRKFQRSIHQQANCDKLAHTTVTEVRRRVSPPGAVGNVSNNKRTHSRRSTCGQKTPIFQVRCNTQREVKEVTVWADSVQTKSKCQLQRLFCAPVNKVATVQTNFSILQI